MLGLGVVVAVQDQILHDLPIGLCRGAPVQQNSGRRQGAQAQVRWGRRGSWGAEEEKGRGGITGSPSPGAVVRQGVRSRPFFFLLHWNKPQTTKQNELWSLQGDFLENTWGGGFTTMPPLPETLLHSWEQSSINFRTQILPRSRRLSGVLGTWGQSSKIFGRLTFYFKLSA